MIALVLLAACGLAPAASFDGTPWNLSTGNLSVTFIQASPIGSHPRPGYLEPPPSIDSLKKLKEQGLVAYEDYIAWGAVEREPGKWDWTQHDAIEKAVHAAGLKYVAYCWVHFPPTWLRDDQKQNRTLMRCLEHDQETNYLSIFDPKTIEHYDHFYKALHDHFGEKIDGVYACILGPYGEGNYPLNVPDWVNIGHCHEGFWCGDEFAREQFPNPPPQGIELKTAEQRHRQVEFIKWYHQAIIDFAEKSIQTTLKYFPKEKVRTKPGGNAGGVNPIRWGTYCPGYAKMAARYGIVLQPADWHGAYFGDKWVATAYHFYNVPLGTEPAGGLTHDGFVKRLFSDASCGTKQLFTYEFDQHAADIQKYAHLITSQPGDTEIAVFCPTTMYRLGADLSPTIHHADDLRDIADYDVLDELLIADGALKFDHYKLLLVFQGDFIDQPTLDRMADFLHAGGQILIAGSDPVRNLDGVAWDPSPPGKPQYVGGNMIKQFKKTAPGMLGYDGVEDRVWTTHRGRETIRLNTGDKPVTIDGVEIAPHEMSDQPGKADFISISPDKRGFIASADNTPFIPWGFNYDRDSDSHLLEDYWLVEWPRIVEDFSEMKLLGANVVRIHLQFGAFLNAPDSINEANFRQLELLLRLAQDTGLRLDLTGLACYRKQDVPAWYDDLDESKRWDAQARFWEEVARRCADSPAVFCYDLMNEPVASTDKKQPDRQWLVNAPLAGFYFVQYLNLDPAGRSRDQIFHAWVTRLTQSIRKHDSHHLITVGMLPFAPGEVARDLDYLSVHVYPERGKVDDALKIVRAFNGFDKPIVIEETFPLSCGADDLATFITRSRSAGAAGWIGFYWGKTPAELKNSKDPAGALTLAWLDLFQKANPNHPNKSATRPAGKI